MQRILHSLFKNDTFIEALEQNISRIFYLSLIIIPISALHIVVLAFFLDYSEPSIAIWHNKMMLTHFALIVFASLMSFFAYVISHFEKPYIKTKISLQIIFLAIFMVSGVLLTAIDQSHTTSITPFIILSVILALVVLMPPWMSVILFLSLFALFYIVMTYVVQDSLLLTTISLNGVTVSGLSAGLSNILWNTFTKTVSQRKLIEHQNAILGFRKFELEQLNVRLEHLVTKDNMTQLLNRREFENRINTEIDLYKSEEFISTMIFTDIDEFKTINDRYGHLFGDELLKHFADLLKEVIRDKDLVARWGGDEFALLLHRVKPEDAIKIAERLRKNIEASEFVINGIIITITASFGIASLCSCEERALYSSYLRADKALYRAKQNGRNKIVVELNEELS